MGANDELIVDLLTSREIITHDQAEEALQHAVEQGMGFVEALDVLDIMPENKTLQLIASEYGMDTFDLSEYKIPPNVIALMPPDVARRYKVVPLMKTDDQLVIGMSDPTDLETLDSLRHILSEDVEGAVVSRRQLKEALDFHFGSMEDSVSTFLEDITEGTVDVSEMTSAEEAYGDEGSVTEDDAPIIRLVSLIILEAFKNRASDIHLEPLEKRFRVRYRIDGVLNEVESPPRYLQNNILSRVKIMAKLDISEHRVPQDGRIQISAMGRELDLRVSNIPTTHGESIVMRILDKSSIMLGIAELGFLSDDQETISRIISMPDGLFLVTGPTGSGKTTSLYAFLNTINQPTTKIITVEDPVEYELSGINQVQVNASVGMSFSNALRAMMRQAPNIIMVGEIRDLETGEIAINAAQTGHLVFSTLHTNDAPSAVSRLVDMGVKPFLVASSLRAIMAQRLVRKVCPRCVEQYNPEKTQLDALHLPHDYFSGTKLMKGVGCNECKEGYRGRIGIFELFMIDEATQQLVYEGVSASRIRRHARSVGMRTLREDGLRKVANGTTTIEEVIRVTASDESNEFESA